MKAGHCAPPFVSAFDKHLLYARIDEIYFPHKLIMEVFTVSFIDGAVLGTIIVLMSTSTLFAQGPQPDPSMPAPLPGVYQPTPVSTDMLDRHTFRVSPPELVSPGVYRIGEILVNKAEKSITFPAVVNMNSGLLEYLLVRSGGKTHESLFRTKVEPYNLQIACLLLDLAGTDKPLPFQGAPEAPKGDQVRISVEYVLHNGRSQTLNPKDWVMQTIDGVRRDAPELKWIFTGSMVSNGRFAAQVDGSIIALYHDPSAMIDNATAGGESDKIWFVNEKTAPPIGTPVTITIKPLK